MADSSTSKGIVKYSSRDYESIMKDFWDIVPTLTEAWTPQSDSDPGVVLDELLAACENLIDRHFLVYAHVFPDKHAYVGMTGTSVQDRSGSNGTMYANHRPEMLKAAQELGGWDKVKHYTLVQGLTYDEACKFEELFTKLFESAGYIMYNLKCGWKGYKHTEEARNKIGESSAGHILSEEAREKISIANSGRKRTEEQKSAQRQRLLDYYTPERRKEHSERCMEGNRQRQCGKHLSPEAKSKISAKHKGRQISEDWRAKLSASHKGKIPSNAKIVIATVDGRDIEFMSGKECDRYFHKYSDWATSHCKSGKVTPEGIKLRYKEEL